MDGLIVRAAEPEDVEDLTTLANLPGVSGAARCGCRTRPARPRGRGRCADAGVLLGVETHEDWSMEAERMADCMPDATLALVPGVNHRGPVVAPATIVRSILNFVDSPR